jgi:hypothetical protein
MSRLGDTRLETAISRPEVVSSYLASCQVRGMAPESAQFIADLWSHPETIRACSEAAGVDLVPIMEYEVGSNISIHCLSFTPRLAQMLIFFY